MLKTLPELIAQAKANINTVTAEQALKSYNENTLLIDVREPAEHQQKSIVDAINIPRGILEMQMLKNSPDELKEVYLFCAVGGRAVLAAEQLSRLGYQNVFAITCSFEKLYSLHAEQTIS